MLVLTNSISRVHLYVLVAQTLAALLLPISLLAVDVELRRVGGCDCANGRVAVSGGYAYVGGTVLDVSNPANPLPIASYDTTEWRYGLPVSTKFTYAPDADETWMVTDVSDPTRPHVVGGYKTMALTCGVKVSGKYAYTINTEKTLWMIDVIEISDPANPRLVATYEGTKTPVDMAISGKYAYVAAGGEGLQVLDISNPSGPTLRGSVTLHDHALSVGVSGDYAFVGGASGLYAIDIRNPVSPALRRLVQTDRPVQNISLSGNYVCSTAYGSVALFDISDPGSPKFAGRSEGLAEYARSAAISRGYAYFTGSFHGLDVIEIRSANPQRIATLQFGTDTSAHGLGGFVTAVATVGNYAYATDDEAGLQVIDINETSNPRRVGRYGTRGEFYGLAVSGNYAYVGGTFWDGSKLVDNGLHVLDVSDPTRPWRVGGTSFPGNFNGPVVSGNYAYLAGYSYSLGDGLYVFDLSSPAKPRQLARHQPAGFPSQLAVSGMYAYVTTLGSYHGTNYMGGGGLEVVEITDPDNPRKVGGYDTFYSARSVSVSGHYAFVTIEPEWTETNSIGDLIVFDISDPRNPRRVAAYGSGLSSVVVSGDFAYANGPAGLEVIDLTQPADPRHGGGNSAVFPEYGTSHLVVSEARVFVAAADQGFVILDLSRPFRLEALASSNPGTMRLRLDGPRTMTPRIQRSTNLSDWEDWKPIIPGAAPIEVSDSDVAPLPYRFYRAVSH